MSDEKRRAHSTPTRPAFLEFQAVAEIFGYSPSFVPCELCKQLTTASPCFDCARRASRARDEAAELALWKEQRAADLARLRNLPEAYSWAVLGAHVLEERVKLKLPISCEEMASIVKNFEGPLVLFRGDSRMGKTSLAIAIARATEDGSYALSPKLARVKSETPLGKVSDQLAWWRPKDDLDDDAKPAKAFRACPLLVIDEFGSEVAYQRDEVKALIWEREQAGLKTILTSWMSPAELADLYGAGLFGRLTERTRALIVEFGVRL